MSAEKVQWRIDKLRETGGRLRTVRDIKTILGEAFNKCADDYGKMTKAMRKRLRPELRQLWFQYRAAMRVEVDLRTEYENAHNDIMQALAVLGQSLGERLPEQFEDPEPGEPLL